MRTYAVFQACDKYALSRLVDRIVVNVNDGVDFYKNRCGFGEVLFLPDHNEKKDMPEHLMFLEPDDITIEDIDWLRENQDHYGTPIIDEIQEKADSGYVGMFRGICVRIDDDEVFVKHLFLVELRHIYGLGESIKKSDNNF